MNIDIRAAAAKFYDYNPETPVDIRFYRDLIPSADASVLELGCGTGRVTLPMADYCRYIHGIDLSPAMISICQEKLSKAKISSDKAQVELGDITHFALGRTFDLIIAPFRVLQNLETDAEVDGLFRCIRAHLSPGGTCVLNVFRPNYEPEALRQQWVSHEEKLNWEAWIGGKKLVCLDRRPRMDKDKLILYPELIYRLYEDDNLIEEAVLQLLMRCYYPATFERLILDHGFNILNKWGGYAGEIYGDGTELVIQFGSEERH